MAFYQYGYRSFTGPIQLHNHMPLAQVTNSRMLRAQASAVAKELKKAAAAAE
jgi:hypothetical protein